MERDNKVKENIEKITAKLEELESNRPTGKFITACNYQGTNIRACSYDTLVKMYLEMKILLKEFEEEKKTLGTEELIISGYSLNSWIEDVKTQIQISKYIKDKKTLTDAKSKLEKYYSEDYRADKAISDIMSGLCL